MKPLLTIHGFQIDKDMIKANVVDSEMKHIPSRHKLIILIRDDDYQWETVEKHIRDFLLREMLKLRLNVF